MVHIDENRLPVKQSNPIAFVHIVTAEAPPNVAIESNGSNTAIRYFDNENAANDCLVVWAHKGLKVMYCTAPVFNSFDAINLE